MDAEAGRDRPIAVAVGDELAIAHRADDAALGFTILTFGGPALYPLAQLLFLRARLWHARPPALAAPRGPRARHRADHG